MLSTKMGRMTAIFGQSWLKLSFLLLIGLGLVGSLSTNATSSTTAASAVQVRLPNQRRRFNEPRLMADDEKDRKGAGELSILFIIILFCSGNFGGAKKRLSQNGSLSLAPTLQFLPIFGDNFAYINLSAM